MSSKKSVISIRINDDLLEKVTKIAEKSHRNRSLQIDYFLTESIEKYEKENGPIIISEKSNS